MFPSLHADFHTSYMNAEFDYDFELKLTEAFKYVLWLLKLYLCLELRECNIYSYDISSSSINNKLVSYIIHVTCET